MKDPSCLFYITWCVREWEVVFVIIIASGSLAAGCASSAVHFLEATSMFVRP